jgi:putative resolvase
MPVPARRLESGTIWVDVAAESATGRVVLYARVSSPDQRSDLDRQVAWLTAWATSNSYAVAEVVCEVGSGLKRPKLRRINVGPFCDCGGCGASRSPRVEDRFTRTSAGCHGRSA